ncbi:AraC family transcriptional regulator [Oceanobacillus picturae]|uniref:AraC family transcriptional regulator n=1 Tax=Oceanobacillus picturae TaxID=171693 RepID=UPI003627BB0E
MCTEFEIIPNYRLAYMRQVGPYGPTNMKTMEKLKDWAKEKNLFIDSAIVLGIPQDNPETTLPERCRYDACIVVTEDYPLDGSPNEGRFAGGEYIVYKVKHTPEAVKEAWSKIHTTIKNSGYQIDNKPILERYTVHMVNSGNCELCIPVTR